MTLPPTAWSVRGKRSGRRRTAHGDQAPRDEDRDAALFLLSLASCAAASDLRLDGIASAPTTEAEEQQRLRWRTKNKRNRKKERTEVAEKTKWRPRVHECEFCPGRFGTAQALDGYTKNHLERDVRGRPLKRKMRKISSLPFDSGLGFHFKPHGGSPGSSLKPFSSLCCLGGKEAHEEENDAGGKRPSSSLFC